MVDVPIKNRVIRHEIVLKRWETEESSELLEGATYRIHKVVTRTWIGIPERVIIPMREISFLVDFFTISEGKLNSGMDSTFLCIWNYIVIFMTELMIFQLLFHSVFDSIVGLDRVELLMLNYLKIIFSTSTFFGSSRSTSGCFGNVDNMFQLVVWLIIDLMQDIVWSNFGSKGWIVNQRFMDNCWINRNSFKLLDLGFSAS